MSRLELDAWLTPTSWAVLAGDEIIACAGLVEIWPGRAYAWSILSEGCGAYFRRLHGMVRTVLERTPYRRIEATVDAGFTAGHRWMRLLGFEAEGTLRAYNPDGTDAVMYARVQWPE